MNTLLDQLIPRTERQVEMGTTVPTAGTSKTRRRRWSKPKRRTKADRIEQELRLGAELRQRRAKWAASLIGPQTELLGPWLPAGIEAVKRQEVA